MNTEQQTDEQSEPTIDLLDVLSLYPAAGRRPGSWLHDRDNEFVELDNGIVVRLDEVSNRLEQMLHPGRRGQVKDREPPRQRSSFRAPFRESFDVLVSPLTADLERLYREATGRYEAALRAWDEAGRPLLGKGSRGQVQEHALVTLLRTHELLLVRLAAPLRKRHRGPEPSAVPSIRKPKSSSLKAVR